MHKHFRMIAISEHLRNHGFDPDYYQHTRIPHIWQKLKTYYNLDIIDERENFDDDEPEDRYTEFRLPMADFYESMMQRVLADPSEAPTSPPEFNPDPSSSPPKKRKRGDTVSRTRGASREDTEEAADSRSPAARSTRGSRGRTRAASRSKAERAETTEEENEGEDEDVEESGSGDEDGDEQEAPSEAGSTAKTSKSGKAPPKKKAPAPSRTTRSRK